MQRYHDTRSDPLPIHSPQRDIERANLERQMAEFLLRGGEIEQVGHKMSSAPATFTINPERTPVYAHLFSPVAPDATPEVMPSAQIGKQHARGIDHGRCGHGQLAKVDRT